MTNLNLIEFLRLLYGDNSGTSMDEAGRFQFWGGLVFYIAGEEASRRDDVQAHFSAV